MRTIHKTMIILTLLILSITIIAFNKQNSNIDGFIQESELEGIVSQAISDFASPKGYSINAVFECHEIVGKELKMNTLSVYVIGYVMGIYNVNQGFGGEFPAHIKIKKIEGDYKVVYYKDALASADVYRIMPRKYASSIRSYNTSSLHEAVKKQIEDWKKSNRSN